MKKLFLTSLALHLLCLSAENNGKIIFRATTANVVDILLNTGSTIIATSRLIPYPPLNYCTSALVASGLTGSALFHAYNRQGENKPQQERVLAALKANEDVTGMKIQNSACFTLALLPAITLFSYMSAKQNGKNFCKTAASAMPRGAKLAFTLSYLCLSAIGAVIKDPHAPIFTK